VSLVDRRTERRTGSCCLSFGNFPLKTPSLIGKLRKSPPYSLSEFIVSQRGSIAKEKLPSAANMSLSGHVIEAVA
jgi:hypothetical protein